MGPNANPQQQNFRRTRVKNCVRTFLAHLFSHIGLCILVVGYAIVGAAIFERLESKFEMEQRSIKQKNWTSTFTKIRKRYVTELWNITEQFNVLYEKNWTSAVEQELRRFEEIVAAAAEEIGYDASTKDTDLDWSFSGALLYSVSIITTIGYGNTAPRTRLGKVLTMFYAIIGVPLMLLWLSNIGTLMANTFKFVYNHICCRNKLPRSRSVQKRSPSSKQEPSSIQVKYSVSAMTCETHVVQQQQQNQQLHHLQSTDPSNFHVLEKQPRSAIRREQRATLKNLDPAAKQMLKECAEYNVNMSQDERSRMVLQQLHAADAGMGAMTGIEEEMSDDGEAIVDMILPPPVNIDGTELDYGCGIAGGGSVSVSGNGGNVNGSMGRTGGGSACQISQVEGTPSRVPLLHRGVDGGPDVVDVETLDEYPTGSIDMISSRNKEQRCESPVSSDRVPISLVLIFVVFYIMGGAVVFSFWEDWSILESAYFCFITLSTIGLGDYVPGRSLKTAGTEEGHAQLIVCCLYLVLGLAIIAMSFNLVQEEVAAKVKDIARHIGIIKDSSGDR